jgi:hypothetical protein
MDVEGHRLQLSVEQLQNQSLYQRACMEQIHLMPPLMKPQRWQKTVNDLMQSAVTVDVPPELTITGQFHDLLRSFCTSQIRAMAPEDMEMGKPWTENGETCFTMQGIEQFLTNRNFKYTRVEIQEQLEKLNGGKKCSKKKYIKKVNGHSQYIRVWHIPAFEEDQVSLEPKEYDDDVPF